jgi:SAM-dependent methyltransferase
VDDLRLNVGGRGRVLTRERTAADSMDPPSSTDSAWEQWGARDPYFGVLTDPRFRSDAITPALKDEFFEAGRIHVLHVYDVLRHHADPGFAPLRILDFGCGVGRLLVHFAAYAKSVDGLDVSPSMLAEARRNCEARGVFNASLLLSDDELSAAGGHYDLVHSCIVLQHLEIPRGRMLFQKLVQRIRPGGCGAIHVTFGWTMHAATWGQTPPPPPEPRAHPLLPVKLWIRRRLDSLFPKRAAPVAPTPEPSPDPEMQMNYYNLSELMFILQRAGAQQVYTEMTDHGGALGAFLYFRIAPSATPVN